MQKNTLRNILLVLVDDFGYEAVQTSLQRCRAGARTIEGPKQPASLGRSKSRPRRSAMAVVETLDIVDVEKKDILLVLAKAYEEKKFMPNLNMVRAFLTQHGHDVSKVKARQQVVPTLFKCLASLETQKLCELHERGLYAGPKSLAVIARSIEDYGTAKRAITREPTREPTAAPPPAPAQ